MDYQQLAYRLPISPQQWKIRDVTQWLQFIGLKEKLGSTFLNSKIDGHALVNLKERQLQNLGVKSNIIRKKILIWVEAGFPEFQRFLNTLPFDNKQNLPPQCMERKSTKESDKMVEEKPWKNKKDDGLVIRGCDGNIAAFYVMKEKCMKIGRSQSNVIRSLEVSVEEEHAQISNVFGKYCIKDKGTEAGTYLKITTPRILKVGTLIEMGNFLIEVIQLSKQTKTLIMYIIHMQNPEAKNELSIQFSGDCTFFSFGRRKTNNFYSDDEHLSSIHSKIFMQKDEFVIEDMHSTNGTWLRLSKSNVPSQYFQLQQNAVFKVGSTITYQCLTPDPKPQKMEIEYDQTCLNCSSQKRDILLLPCRHNVVCSKCSWVQSCPVCQSQISERIKIYT